ncbi:MAG: ABC transporter ATP-binding protein, partial [Spirochaetales bacterium]|nr:ABC transporter ATP-binding protein [Spirochaetales bacterium]
MLKIEHLTKVFYPGTVNEKMAINDLSLNVEEGEIVCVIG